MQFANQRMIQAIDLCAMCTPKEAGLVTLLFTALVNDVAKGVIDGCYVRSWFLVQISRLIKGIFDEILVATGCELEVSERLKTMKLSQCQRLKLVGITESVTNFTKFL